MTLNPALFASVEAHPRKVTLQDGTEVELYFREIPAIELRRQHLAETSDDPAVRDGALARLISVGLCNEDGTPAITPEQAGQLRPAVAGQMVTHILALAGFGGDDAGNA